MLKPILIIDSDIVDAQEFTLFCHNIYKKYFFDKEVMTKLKSAIYNNGGHRLDLVTSLHGRQDGFFEIGPKEFIDPLGIYEELLISMNEDFFKDKIISGDFFSCFIGSKVESKKQSDPKKYYPDLNPRNYRMILNGGKYAIHPGYAQKFAEKLKEENLSTKPFCEHIINKILHPQDTFKLDIYDDSGVRHTFKHSGLKQNGSDPIDLSDENLRNFLAAEVRRFLQFYKTIKFCVDEKENFADIETQTIDAINNFDVNFFRQLRTCYLTIDLLHEQSREYFLKNFIGADLDPDFVYPPTSVPPLFYAIESRDLLEAMLQNRNVNINKQHPESKNTPLMVLLLIGEIESAKLFLERKDEIDLSIQNCDGEDIFAVIKYSIVMNKKLEKELKKFADELLQQEPSASPSDPLIDDHKKKCIIL